jgi:hypothetical protein
LFEKKYLLPEFDKLQAAMPRDCISTKKIALKKMYNHAV